jgi:putative ABC transport system permease protein
VAMQVGAACVLLIVSGLLARGITRIVRVPLGFEYRQAVVVDPHLESHGMTPGAARNYWRTAETRLRSTPGVADVGLTTLPPFGRRVTINGAGTLFYRVAPSYFQTMTVAIRRGRTFTAGEQRVTIVSETLARRTWPSLDPLGQTFEGMTVVGVSADARTVRVGDESATECYLPMDEAHLERAVMVVRLTGTAAGAANDVIAAMRNVDARVTPTVTALTDALEDKLETPREIAAVAGVLGACALLLAVAGVAGLVAFTVSQRVREIGVRLALGARGRDVVAGLGRQFVRPVTIGMVAGGGLAALSTRLAAHQLVGVTTADPLVYLGAAILFLGTSLMATLPSIARALRVDPAAALRHE